MVRSLSERSPRRAMAGLLLIAIASGCANGNPGNGGSDGPNGSCTPPSNPVLTLAAYSTPREAYGKIIPAFQAKWKADHNGQSVIVQESYAGSTSQAQNVVGGFPADIVVLSLAPDVDVIEKAGLITHDWTKDENGGMVSASVVVFDVRTSNPKAIKDYDSLTQGGLSILTPDPASSGGARWNIVAAYGAALRGKVSGYSGDDTGAGKLLEGTFKNVTVLDKSARDSIKNFESGNGDVAITYENEVLTAQKAGLKDEMVIPSSTVLIENPVAVVDKNAEKHCVKTVADGFVSFLHTDEAQAIFKTVGFLRPADASSAKAGDGKKFAPITDLFTVADLGGWDKLNTTVFGNPDGVFTKAFAAAHT
jgi:sulfate/thiosulfate-binding protein